MSHSDCFSFFITSQSPGAPPSTRWPCISPQLQIGSAPSLQATLFLFSSPMQGPKVSIFAKKIRDTCCTSNNSSPGDRSESKLIRFSFGPSLFSLTSGSIATFLCLSLLGPRLLQAQNSNVPGLSAPCDSSLWPSLANASPNPCGLQIFMQGRHLGFHACHLLLREISNVSGFSQLERHPDHPGWETSVFSGGLSKLQEGFNKGFWSGEITPRSTILTSNLWVGGSKGCNSNGLAVERPPFLSSPSSQNHKRQTC